MSRLSDTVLAHLRSVTDLPDLGGTKYRLVEPIARGGMGMVYLVEDEDLGRRVALKVLFDPDPGGELAARMLAEARIIARLEHPSIVPIHDVGTLPDDRVFYVMKYVQGHGLDREAHENRSLAPLLRIFQRLCEAVAFAHSHGVIHCDLKPENVMVGQFGEVLVMDWGIARAITDRPSPEDAGNVPAITPDESAPVMGTPAYMAPEQVEGRSEAISPRTDIYALGAILYFLLVRRPPHDAGSFSDRRSPERPHAPVPPHELAENVPRAVEAICMKAMENDPAGRYPGARELADDVSRYLDGLSVTAHRESWLEQAMRFIRRHRFVVILIVAYLLMRALVFLFSGL